MAARDRYATSGNRASNAPPAFATTASASGSVTSTTAGPVGTTASSPGTGIEHRRSRIPRPRRVEHRRGNLGNLPL